MQINARTVTIVGLTLIAVGVAVFAVSVYYLTPEPKVAEPAVPEEMTLVVYLQDKEAARTTDCGITYPVEYQVAQTLAVADVSLQILFTNELAQYGRYDSVKINDGVAQILLQGDRLALGALSSCEGAHLMNVLTDTLTQYQSITTIELYTSAGKVEF